MFVNKTTFADPIETTLENKVWSHYDEIVKHGGCDLPKNLEDPEYIKNLNEFKDILVKLVKTMVELKLLIASPLEQANNEFLYRKHLKRVSNNSLTTIVLNSSNNVLEFLYTNGLITTSVSVDTSRIVMAAGAYSGVPKPTELGSYAKSFRNYCKTIRECEVFLSDIR